MSRRTIRILRRRAPGTWTWKRGRWTRDDGAWAAWEGGNPDGEYGREAAQLVVYVGGVPSRVSA